MQHLQTLYGYSCRLLGLPVGSACRSAKHPPRHTGSFSRRMTWKRTDHEPPTINSHPEIAAGHPPPPSRACTPPPGPPVTANLPTRQPQRFGAWTTMGPGGGGAPGDAAASGRPPRPGLHAGGWRFGITVCPGSGGDAGNLTVIPPPPGICGMAVHSRGLMGSMHRRCFSSSSSLNTNSSIGRVTHLVRRDIPRRADVVELVLRPEHAGIVYCTLTLPKYPSRRCRGCLPIHQFCSRWPGTLRR